ncbi:hypothetical protein PHYPSEUDO_002564 [Phytophthora pseudosyringae]|uniref:Uncharacterized protein n=1 Tax=Phytophthora pseudosyringae TaxID=221518 RepID=A0A8T1VWR8_9STRA|nr:hypothetical protein PHYPSEUDO_002564 [Phytophthora pseudosyringae]
MLATRQRAESRTLVTSDQGQAQTCAGCYLPRPHNVRPQFAGRLHFRWYCRMHAEIIAPESHEWPAMNLLNAHTQLASIIIVIGWPMVKFEEVKWLYHVKRDEFCVWTLSFTLTLCWTV